MSNQFNYDLDERQIKIMLQNAELEYNEDAWTNFEMLHKAEPKTVSVKSMPTINIGISRSVIVPIVFIVLIGGFSSILFSFVDFKKKPEVIKEIPLVVTPYVKPKVVEKLKPKSKPIITSTLSVSSTPTLTQVVATPTLTINKPIAEPVHIEKPEIAKVLVANNNTVNISPKVKKIKKRVVSEELPTITTPINNLNENTVEPELKLP